LTEAGTGAEIDVVTHGGTYGTDPSGARSEERRVGKECGHWKAAAAGGRKIGTQTAGTPFSVKVIARDSFNNTVTGFTGTVDVSSNKSSSSGRHTTSYGAWSAVVCSSEPLTEAGTGAEIDVVTHGGTYGTDPSGA